MKKIALIPAYEPNNKIIDLLKELKKENFETIVIDDGSGEKYSDIFKKSQKYATVLVHKINKGKGRALKTGLSYIEKTYKNNYIVITMDSDMQHTVKDANKLYEVCLKNKKSLILGKRLRKKETPIRSKLGNIITRFFFKLVTKVDIYDTQTGLRAFSDEIISNLINIKGERFEYEINVLLACVKNNINIKEVEIETIYIDNNSGTHFKAFRDSILIYKELIKFLLPIIIIYCIDLLTFIILIKISINSFLSNIISIFISLLCYIIFNRKVIFKSNNILFDMIKCYLIIFILIIINSILFELINSMLLNIFVVKLLIDLLLLYCLDLIFIKRSYNN